MKSETVRINNKENMDAVLVAADAFLQRLSLSKKDALHMRLIVEETVDSYFLTSPLGATKSMNLPWSTLGPTKSNVNSLSVTFLILNK